MIAHPHFHKNYTYLFSKSTGELRSSLTENLNKNGLIPPQLGILSILAELGPKNQLELGEMMKINKSTMVRFLDDLITKELVTKETCEHDRRVKYVSITKKGSKLCKQNETLRNKIEKDFLNILNAEEKKQLLKILVKLNSEPNRK